MVIPALQIDPLPASSQRLWTRGIHQEKRNRLQVGGPVAVLAAPGRWQVRLEGHAANYHVLPHRAQHHTGTPAIRLSPVIRGI